LHTVKIKKNAENDRVELNLSYDFDSEIAKKQFTKFGDDKYLLDEIYDRTLKMERERRYCMRYLRPHLSLDSIRVIIVIQNSRNAYQCDTIRYTLEENGYPSDPSSGSIKQLVQNEPHLRTGKDEVEYMKREWGY
jgi:hypothetical protein